MSAGRNDSQAQRELIAAARASYEKRLARAVSDVIDLGVAPKVAAAEHIVSGDELRKAVKKARGG